MGRGNLIFSRLSFTWAGLKALDSEKLTTTSVRLLWVAVMVTLTGCNSWKKPRISHCDMQGKIESGLAKCSPMVLGIEEA